MTQSMGMTWGAFALVLTGVLLNAIAQLALKASVHDTGVIEHRSNKCTGSMANTAILIGRHMRG